MSFYGDYSGGAGGGAGAGASAGAGPAPAGLRTPGAAVSIPYDEHISRHR